MLVFALLARQYECVVVLFQDPQQKSGSSCVDLTHKSGVEHGDI